MNFFEEYQEFTETTAIYPEQKAIEYLVLGLSSEAGEVAGVLKKAIRDNEEIFDYKNFNTPEYRQVKSAISAELGDVCWYLAQLCLRLGLNLDEILDENIAKLSSRKSRNRLRGSGDYR